MKIGGYKIEDIYQGGYSSFDSSTTGLAGEVNYRLPTSALGAPTKPDTANQIQQVNQLLNQGMIPIEVGALSPDVFDQIPKQHFKELKELANLNKSRLSVHAPLVDPSGIDQQGRGWSEREQKLAEDRLKSVVEKSFDLTDKGGIPITIHGGGFPSSEFMIDPKTKQKKIQKLMVIDQEKGTIQPLEEEKKYYFGRPGLAKGEAIILDPESTLTSLNHTQWDNAISQVVFNKENADRILEGKYDAVKKTIQDLALGKTKMENLRSSPHEVDIINRIESARTYLDQARLNMQGIFDKAYKYAPGTEEKKKEVQNKLRELSEDYRKMVGNLTQEDLEKMNESEAKKAIAEAGIRQFDPKVQSDAMGYLIRGLKKLEETNSTPEFFVPIERFAKEKSTETFANIAMHNLELSKKFKKEPVKLGIENLFPGMGFVYGKDMEDLILGSRKKFVEKAVAKGISKSEAEKQAEKMIGMTFDVGHLNIAKKSGFTDEDLAKESEAIAKYVKHVHLTDNFGFSDSHLPPGMGNVPFSKHLQNLKDKGVIPGENVDTIVEAAGIPQHFGTSPFPYILEAMSSPIYSMEMGPYWNQVNGLYQGYFSGYGNVLPSTHYGLFGAGFSQLPAELGGQVGGQGSRMSGRGME